jgi:oligopeptide transport system substrate-binding protein
VYQLWQTYPIRRSVVYVLSLWLLPVASLWAAAVDYQHQRIAIPLTAEPPNLDSAKTTDAISILVLSQINEGLLRYDQSGELTGAVAQRWQMNGKQVRFQLRHNARWSDGRAVTAADFIAAWRRVVDPATASSYAFLMYPVKNAQAINRGELPPSALGVKALSDDQLLVELERPCAYFFSLMAFPTYYPQRRDFAEAQGQHYAADADNLLFNGPFALASWVHGASLKLVKNPLYWDQADVRLQQINIDHITSDTGAILNLFKNDEIAMTDLGAETLQTALQSRLYLQKFPTGYLYFVRFNLRPDHITANKTLRRALQAVFDSETYTNKVVARPGVLPGRSLFPMSVRGIKRPFRLEYPMPAVEVSLTTGKKLLAQAKRELGVSEIPPLVLLTSDSPAALRHAEYLQNLFHLTLGLRIRLERQIAKQFWAKEDAGEFDLTISSWGPDYDDAMTFGDLFTSWNQNNRGQYHNPEYDHWVEVAQNNLDAPTRMQAFDHMQKLISTDAVILPLFESALLYVQHPQLKGVVRYRFGGDISFRYAEVVKP